MKKLNVLRGIMNSLTQYDAAKAQLRAGDVVMFWGHSPLSWAIELFDNGPSHSAVVQQPLTSGSDVLIVESTIENGRNGVQINPLGSTIAGYDAGGRIAALRLDDATRAKMDWDKFRALIQSAVGHVGYDIPDLFEFVIRDIPILGSRVAQTEHKTKMVCSSWVVAVLESCGVLTGINWTKATPQDIVEMHIFRDFIPLLGKPTPKRFNTI